MDQTQLQQQIALYYSKLPSDAQAVFSSMKWMDSLRDISAKYALSEGQIETLATETTLVMLGIIDMDEYNDNIQREISISTESIVKMTKDIDDLVLATIRPQLQETFEKNSTELIEKAYGDTKKLDERFLSLPPELQRAISESNYQSGLYGIASKYKLSIDQMSSLEEVTTKLVLNMIHPDSYEKEVESKVGLPKDKSIELVNEINESVLKSIRSKLKEHWNDSNKNVAHTLEEEVPRPPYKETLVTEKTIVAPKAEEKIYKDAGIEVLNENIDKKEEAIPTPSPVQTPSGADMLADKLSKMTMSSTGVSDHSIPRVAKIEEKANQSAPDNLPTKKYDPYHEPIN
jgi:hypothetical protein